MNIEDDQRFMAWDVETAGMESFHWQAKTDYIPHSMNEQCTTILCAAWRGVNGKIQTCAIDPKDVRNDESVVRRIHKELMRCAEDNIIIVHQNGDSFDIPKMKARFLFYRLPPLPKLTTIDTLKRCRGIGFDYRRLDYLDKFLHGEDAGKVETRGWAMWDDIVSRHSTLKKRKAALKEMLEYNKGDIVALERVFDTMRPYMTAFPNMNIWNGTQDNCPNCLSTNTIYRSKPHLANTLTYRRKSCNDCGSWFRDAAAIKEFDKPRVRGVM